MRYISFSARTIEQQHRLAHFGITKWEVKLAVKEDREFFDLALAMNPDALPPIFRRTQAS